MHMLIVEIVCAEGVEPESVLDDIRNHPDVLTASDISR